MLVGFFISNFRNFDDNEQFIGPLSKINLFIGQNNSGKSNILRYVRDVLTEIYDRSNTSGKRIKPSINAPRFLSNSTEKMHVVLKIDSTIINDLFSRTGTRPEWPTWFEDHPININKSGSFKIPVTRDQNGRIVVDSNRLSAEGVNPHLTQQVWSAITQSQGGGFPVWHSQIFEAIMSKCVSSLEVIYIQSFRTIETRIEEFSNEYKISTSDNHIIDQLSELAYPPFDQQDKKLVFEKLRKFIGKVINRDDVSIEIPFDKKTINVTTDGSVIPIEALGSGIHELFMLASLILINEKKLILLEEPEAHMHPGLQRKFMNFLNTEVDSQFLVTTHSAHIVDTVDASVFGVTNVNGKAKVDALLSGNAKRKMCADLGYRPSDLIQANCIIWVEGPSDRIYILHWLKSVAPDLREGVEFSVMFYGGKLLSNVSAEDEMLEDFIGLLPINRYPAILIDSDLGSDGQAIRPTKQRIVNELSKVDGFSWVTFGREIENYVNPEIRVSAIKSAHPSAKKLASGNNRYAKPLDYIDANGHRIESGFDKIKIAKSVCRQQADLSNFDLSEKIADLVAYIRHANRF